MRKGREDITSPVSKLSGAEPVRQLSAEVAEGVRNALQHWVRAPTTPQRVVQRSRIVLLSLDGVPCQRIAILLGVSKTTVERWTKRFAQGGPDALLHDAPGRGRHPSMTAATMRDRLRQANLLKTDDQPVSVRRASKFLGVSAAAVWRALHKSPLSKRRRDRKPLGNVG